MTRALGTSLPRNVLAYLVKAGKMKGSALVHPVTTFRPPLENGICVSRGSVSRCSSGRLSRHVKIILARGGVPTSLAVRRVIKVKHSPCAGF